MNLVIWTAVLIALTFGAGMTKAQECVSNNGQVSKPGNVRYIVAHNKVDPGEDRTVPDRRFIEVFADRDTFTEVKVREMLARVSNRYPAPKLLYVNVFTDLRDIENPEERDLPKISESTETTQESGDTAVATIKGREALYSLYFKNGDFVQGSCTLP